MEFPRKMHNFKRLNKSSTPRLPTYILHSHVENLEGGKMKVIQLLTGKSSDKVNT